MLVLFSCVEMPREWEIRIWFSSVLKLVYWSSLDFLFAEPGWSSGVRSHFSHRGCAAPQFLLSLVSSREWKESAILRLSASRGSPGIFPCLGSPPSLAAELRSHRERRDRVGLFELVPWRAIIAGSNTNYHVPSDKYGGGKKRWSFNKFLMKANDSYINQAASLKGEVSWTQRWQRLTPHLWHQLPCHFSWALTVSRSCSSTCHHPQLLWQHWHFSGHLSHHQKQSKC